MKTILLLILIVVLSEQREVKDDTYISSRVKSMYGKICPWNGFDMGKTCAGVKPSGNRCNGIQPLRTGLGVGFTRGIGANAPIFLHTFDNNTYITVSGMMSDLPVEYNVTYYDINKPIYETYQFPDIDAYYQYLYTSDIIGGFLLKGITVESLIDLWFGHYYSTMSLNREMHITLKLEYNTIPQFLPEFNEIIEFIGENLDDLNYIEKIMDEYYIYFGMDVITEAYIGVLSDQAVFIQKCDYSGIDINVQNMIRLYSSLYPGQYNVGQLNAKYSEHSSATLVDYYGGNVQVLDWSSRVLTSDDLPILLKVKTMPITNFITNATIRNVFEEYIAKLPDDNAAIEKYMEMKKQRWLGYQPIYFVHPDKNSMYCIDVANMRAGDVINGLSYMDCFIINIDVQPKYVVFNHYIDCQRLSDGSVVAKWIANPFFTGVDGVPVQSGCSIATTPVLEKDKFYCCIDCTPVLTDGTKTVTCIHC